MDNKTPLNSHGQRTLILIPAFNEELRLGKVLSGIKALHPLVDILVVDDGSKDGTTRAAESNGALCVAHPFNMGYGVALQTGYKYALRHNYDFLVQMDGDGQHDPSFIKALLDPVQKGQADVVIGSRFLASGPGGADSERYRAPFARRVGMKIFGTIASLCIRQWVSDPTSGYQAMSNKVFHSLAGDKFPVDYPDADVIIMLHKAGYRIREVPVRMFPSPDNKSMHSGFKPLYYIFKMLLSIFVTLLRK
jgi:hypothetical protein